MQNQKSVMNSIDKLTYRRMAMMDHVYDIQLIVLSIDDDAISNKLNHFLFFFFVMNKRKEYCYFASSE